MMQQGSLERLHGSSLARGTSEPTILVVEDDENDFALLTHELGGLAQALNLVRVDTEAEYLRELGRDPKLILADYRVPGFGGLKALQIVRERDIDVPFILISGSISEEDAVGAIRLGATDYLLKDRLARLPSAIEQALTQDCLRREKLAVQSALRAQQDLSRRIIESAPFLVSSVSHDGTLQFLNPEGERVFGRSLSELRGRPISEVCGEQADRLAALIEGSLESIETELYVTRPDGDVRRVEVTAFARRDVSGSVTEYICMGQDVTDKQLLEQRLRQAQKMEAIGQLAGGVAHDFNNLLTVINAYAGFIRSALPEGDACAEDAQQILMAGDRASALTRQLLAFGRRQILKPRPVNLNGVVEGLVPMLTRLIDENVDIAVDLDLELARVHADPHQLEQVLVNLVVNARDAMPEGGTITIRSREGSPPAHHTPDLPEGRYVLLSVTDTGVGMSHEVMRRIFEPFFTTKGVGQGTGLGLSTVHGIARQSGGDIAVHSELGSGATFTLCLPAHHTVDKPDAPTPNNSTVRGGNERILFVDDDPALRRLALRVLPQAGYRVHAASSTEALSLLSTGKSEFQLLITDVIMPKVGGTALADLATKHAGVEKILYISGYSHDTVQRIVRERLAMLPKPFSTTGLLAKVRQVLDGTAAAGYEDTLS